MTGGTVLALALCAGLRAQSTGVRVEGSILDPSAAVISGAEVSLWSRGHKLAETKTDGAGRFRFDGIARGRYELHALYTGFKPETQRIQVGDRAPEAVQIPLKLAEREELVQVQSSERSVNTEAADNLNTVRMGGEDLQKLPMLDHDVVGTVVPLLDPSSMGSGGATVVVDGMTSTEKGIPASDIKEIRINKNPYAAEFARPGKSRIEIITKSGGSKYHGSLYFGMRDYRADARNAFATDREPEQRRQEEATFSGPLGDGKKTNFSISASHSQDVRSPPVFAIGLQGPILEDASRGQTDTYAAVQVTRHIDDNNTLSLRYSHYDWLYTGVGAGGLTLAKTGSSESSQYHQLYSTWKSVLNAKTLNELLVRVRTEKSGVDSALAGVPKVVVEGAFTGGGAQLYQTGSDNRVELSDTISWSAGSHLLKAGINVPEISRQSLLDRSNAQGTFYFASLADYQLGQPFAFTQQASNGRLRFWNMQAAGFVQDDIRLRPNLSVAVGLRYDRQNYLNDRHDFAPRLSFAYAPDKQRKTVFRGGAGIFYDVLPAAVTGDLLRLNGGLAQQIMLTDPGYPAAYAAGVPLAALPPAMMQLDPHLRSPYNLQYSFGVERELPKSLSLSVIYTGIRGVGLFRSRDINAPLAPRLGRPDPLSGQFRQVESSGGLKSRALETMVQGRLGRWFKGMAMYRLAHAWDDTDGINSFPANSWNLSGEWSTASFDVRHFLYLYGTLSAGKYFDLGVIFSARSGLPYNMTTGLDNNGDGIANDRPVGIPRNSLRGTGRSQLDLRWSRELSPGKRLKDRGLSLVLSLDIFNVLNSVTYSSFVGDVSSPLFGRPVSADPARRLQGSITGKF
jgi:hypothetical protein